MKKVKLGDICKIVSGTTPKSSVPEYWDGDIDWITPAELEEDTYIIKESVRKITQKAVKESSLKSFPAGTVILSSRAPIGKVAIAGKEMYCNQGFKNLICSEAIDSRYLYWFLKCNTEYLNSLGRGATFKEISKGIVENIEIPLPSMEQQKYIASVLGKITALISKHQQQRTILDQLVKSQFIEIFGDLETNPKKWPIEKLKDHSDIIAGNPFNSNGYTENGIKICGSLIIMPDRIAWEDCKYWPSSDGLDTYLLESGDIVLAMDRPWISSGFKIAKIKGNELPALLIQRTARIRGTDLNQDMILAMLSTKSFEKHCNITSTTVPHISMGDIRDFSVMVPPKELQTQFSVVVQQADKSKSTIQQSLDTLTTLKKSLMQTYFG